MVPSDLRRCVLIGTLLEVAISMTIVPDALKVRFLNHPKQEGRVINVLPEIAIAKLPFNGINFLDAVEIVIPVFSKF